MKNFLICAVVFVAFQLLTYAVFAFVLANANAFEWGADVRATMAICGGAGGWFCAWLTALYCVTKGIK